MTRETKEYKWKEQAWFTPNTWHEANDEIKEEYREGKVITGICYSPGLKQYFVVMTAIPERKTWKWFDVTEPAASGWMKSLWEYHPTVIFKDPTDKKTLVVMTADENISSSRCTCKFSVKLC